MDIKIRIRKLVDNGTPMKALLSATIDDKFAVHDIKLIERSDGSLFAAMPSRKDSCPHV